MSYQVPELQSSSVLIPLTSPTPSGPADMRSGVEKEAPQLELPGPGS